MLQSSRASFIRRSPSGTFDFLFSFEIKTFQRVSIPGEDIRIYSPCHFSFIVRASLGGIRMIDRGALAIPWYLKLVYEKVLERIRFTS